MYEITVDIETTGLDITKDTPIQFGYIISHNQEIIGKGLFYINPGKKLPSRITEITGIADSTLQQKGYVNKLGAVKWNDLVWQYQPCTLIGYNIINFDFPMIQNWMHHHNPGKFKHPPIQKLIDVMHMASAHFKTRRWLKLENLAQALDVPYSKEDLHDALGDAELTWKCYVKMERM